MDSLKRGEFCRRFSAGIEICRIVSELRKSLVEFCRGKVGFVEICFYLSLIVDEICRILTNNIKECRKVLINMEKWCVEFEVICDIMAKEVEKRKQVRQKILGAYDKMWDLQEKSRKSTTFDEYYEIEKEIDAQNEYINTLETEYNKIDYTIHVLKQARIDVLEK